MNRYNIKLFFLFIFYINFSIILCNKPKLLLDKNGKFKIVQVILFFIIKIVYRYDIRMV